MEMISSMLSLNANVNYITVIMMYQGFTVQTMLFHRHAGKRAYKVSGIAMTSGGGGDCTNKSKSDSVIILKYILL